MNFILTIWQITETRRIVQNFIFQNIICYVVSACMAGKWSIMYLFLSGFYIFLYIHSTYPKKSEIVPPQSDI